MESESVKALSLNFDHPMTRSPDEPIELWRTLKQGPKPVGGDAVDGVGAAFIESAPEQQFAAAIAIDIDGVDQFHAGSHVEMSRIGLRKEQFSQLALEVGAGDQRDLLWFFDISAGVGRDSDSDRVSFRG